MDGMNASWIFILFSAVLATCKAGVSDNDISHIVEEMLEGDDHFVKNGKMEMDFQGHTSSRANDDVASRPLFTKVPNALLTSDVVKTLVALYDNYNPSVGHEEDNTATEQREVDRFLDAVVKTPAMKTLEKFLRSKGLLSRGDMKSLLHATWFNNYSRARGRKDTSAFEHVFVGEFKNNEVSGMHNWVRLYMLEKQGDADYKGFVMKRTSGRQRDPRFGLVRYTWKHGGQQEQKPLGSFMFGTSPQFDLAVYSLCYLARVDQPCRFSIDGLTVEIVTHSNVQGGKKYLGSAYPNIPRN